MTLAALRRFLYRSGFWVGITDREFLDSMFGLSGSIAGLGCRLGFGFLEALGHRLARSTGEPIPGPVFSYSSFFLTYFLSPIVS